MRSTTGDVAYMIVDRGTREAYREEDDAQAGGPLFFTTRERLRAYAQEEAIEDYEVHEVPAGVLALMKGKPHWVDGKQRP